MTSQSCTYTTCARPVRCKRTADARTFRDFTEERWTAHAHNLAADTTRPRKRSMFDRHILPVVGQALRRVRRILDAALADGLVASNVAKAVKALEAATGLTVSPHSLRHYFGASLLSRGVSVAAVSTWLGHSSRHHVAGLQPPDAR